MTKISLNSVTSSNNVTGLNDNFDKIEDEFNERVMYRDNPTGAANTMNTAIDMNGKRILNLPPPLSPGEPVRLSDITQLNSLTGLVEDAKVASSVAISARSDAETFSSQALQANSDAQAAATRAQQFAAGLTASSTTNTTLGTGTKVFTTQANKQFNTGQYVQVTASSDPSKIMVGQVSAYSGNNLELSIQQFEGTGTFNAWNISISGPRGAAGPAGVGLKGDKGDTGDQGPAGQDSSVPGPTGPQGPPGTTVSVKDEGTLLTTGTTSINFTGSGVTATNSGTDVTVNIPTPTVVPPSSTTPLAPATTGAIGTGTTYARADHVHPSDAPLAATASPLSNSSAAVGTSLKYAREDHVHPNTAPQAATVTPMAGGTATTGTSLKYAREDHVHPATTGGGGELEFLGEWYLSEMNNVFPTVFGDGPGGGVYDKIIIYLTNVKTTSNQSITFAGIVNGVAPVVGAYQLASVNATGSVAATTTASLTTSATGSYGLNAKIELINQNSVLGYPGYITCSAVHRPSSTTTRWDMLSWSYTGSPMNGFQIGFSSSVPTKGWVTVYGIKNRT